MRLDKAGALATTGFRGPHVSSLTIGAVLSGMCTEHIRTTLRGVTPEFRRSRAPIRPVPHWPISVIDAGMCRA